MRILLFFVCAISLQAKDLKILSYSSLMGKGSFAEYLTEKYKQKCSNCKLEFVAVKDLSGLLGELRRQPKAYDLVLGLVDRHYFEGLHTGLIEKGEVFERSPVVILADTRKLAKTPLPKSWKELSSSISKRLILQDPRFSNTGAAWLSAIFSHNLLSAKASAKLVLRYYPSWSASYDAFLKGSQPFVWTYLSSQAYHLCHDEKYFVPLQLAEGYPEQKEYVSAVKGKKSIEAENFIAFLLSSEVQEALPQLNWMFPANAQTKLPECFKGVSRVRTLAPADQDFKDFSKWVDQWSLL